MIAWFLNLFRVSTDFSICLARVQLEERVHRRESLERELSGKDAQECLDRVRRRMTLGDSVWIPPMYNREETFRAWKRRHRRHIARPLPLTIVRREEGRG